MVNVASDAHRMSSGLDFDDLMYESRAYSAIKAYGDSKLANILFTVELARRLKGRHVLAHAVHPGVVRTRFGKDGDTAGVLGVLARMLGPFILTPAKGARTSLHVATSSDALSSTGDYWSKQKRRTPNPAARDAKAASKLWSRSEKLVGLI